ncbi:MAG TPA: TIGR02594 family protein [Pseudolabrys sp.]
MRLVTNKRTTVLLCSVAFALLAAPAVARPAHKTKHYRYHAAHDVRHPAVQAPMIARGGLSDSPTAAFAMQQPAAGEATQGSRRTRRGHTGDAFGGFTSNSLVSEARRYMGTNPTGRGRAWCGAFMDMVLKKTGHAGGGNLARAYARYGSRVSGPQVGAIAVMNHHVGVVSGVDPNGNPIIVSGNHNRTVAESVYPRSRIIAYVAPGG